ncbi:MAG: phosphate regulon sensor histidine kinase PhoR [Pseudomonadota bacterium]
MILFALSIGAVAVTAISVFILLWKKRKNAYANAIEDSELLADKNGIETLLGDNIDWLPDGVVVLDQKLRLVWANQNAMNWFGINSRNYAGISLLEQTPESDLSTYLKNRNFRDALDCPAPMIPDTILRVRILPFRNGQLLLQARDITQITNLEMVRRDFVANASHELRTPISIVYGYLEMMLQDEVNVDDQWRPAIYQMHQQTERVKQIIEDMMMLSRLEDSTVPEDHELIIMAQLLESEIKNARVLSGEKSHRFGLNADENYSIEGNPKEIESLVSNLMSNAVRYTPDRGKISISWDVDLAGGALSITDTGIGIAEHDLPRITERFYRTDTARSRETGGTGLGLAIVNHIASRHQANLVVTSTIGKGSTFTVHFPPDRIQKHHDQVNLLLN